MKQTKLESIIEQLLNVGSGFILSFYAWLYIVRPLLDNETLTVDDTFYITSIFTFISVIRGYLWRRAFNKGVPHRIASWVITRVRIS